MIVPIKKFVGTIDPISGSNKPKGENMNKFQEEVEKYIEKYPLTATIAFIAAKHNISIADVYNIVVEGMSVEDLLDLAIEVKDDSLSKIVELLESVKENDNE